MTPGTLPARLLAEEAAADPQRLPGLRSRRCSPRTSPAWPARKPRCRGSSCTTAPTTAGRCGTARSTRPNSPACRTRTGPCWCRTWTSGTPTSPRCCRPSPSCRAGASTTSWCRFAAPGGSVGAHVDQYDVFLLQAQGHRRWQIDARRQPAAGFPRRRRTQAAARIHADPRLGARPGRHALPAAGRAAPRRRRGCLPDLLGRHARALGGGTARRLRRHAGRRRRRSAALRRPGPGAGRRTRPRSTRRR